jgi:nicotinamide-nucleotide amidase
MTPRGLGVVALVLVGDELLAGHVNDTNGPWLGRRLAEAGLGVVSSALVPDQADAVVRAVERALADAPAVVVTGGLGRTSDDQTRPALARLADGRPMRPLPNGWGSEDGVRLDLAQGTVYAVPGVPAEMSAMVDEQVIPDLLAGAGDLPPRVVGSLLVVGLGEREVADLLAPMEATTADAVRLAFLPRPGEVEVRIRAEGADARAAAERSMRRARELLGDTVAAEGQNLEQAVVGSLVAAGATVAAAESLTGGLLAGALVSVPGVSAVFRGGVVAYTTELKADLAGVPADLLDRDGAVATTTAVAMADGVRRRCGARYGVATTGVAGPDPQEGRPAGTFHVAVTWADGVRVLSRRPSPDRASTRDTVRRLAVVRALDLLRRAVGDLGAGPGESWPPPTR